MQEGIHSQVGISVPQGETLGKVRAQALEEYPEQGLNAPPPPRGHDCNHIGSIRRRRSLPWDVQGGIIRKLIRRIKTV